MARRQASGVAGPIERGVALVGWRKKFPLLTLLALLSIACTPAAPGGGTGIADRGKQLFSAKGCIACHVVKGVQGATGTVGPALDGVGDPAKRPKIAGERLDNNAENLKKWLANPPAVKPDTPMPNLSLSPQEIDDLVAFLQTLK